MPLLTHARRLPPFATRLSRRQHSDTSIASVAERVRVLQSQAEGASRLEAKKPGDTFRIAVVGDALVGKEELVNALLENPQVSEVVNEKKSLADGLKDTDVVTVSYGSTFSKTANASRRQTDIELGLDWLKNFNTEFVVVPSTSTPASSDLVTKADLAILVTSSASPLSSKLDADFLDKFADKPNVVIAVNSVGNSTHSASDIESFVSSRIAEISSSAPQLPVFNINTKAARTAQRDTSSPNFSQEWAKSGVQDLKTRILQTVGKIEARQSVQDSGTGYSARLVASSLLKDVDNSIELLEAVEKRVQKVLLKGLVSEQERLRLGFVESDLSGVGEKVGGLLASVRDYFRGVGVGTLIWRSDTVAVDLEARIRGNSLSQAEYRMTYAIGKLNEGLYTLYARTRAELASLAGEAHPLSAYTSTKDLQSDITRIIDILDKQAPAKNGGVQVDAFVLKNLVSSGFDVSQEVEDIQNKADYTVRSFFGSQLLFATGGVFATYLGVPWAISIPSTLLVSGAGFVFSNLRWSSIQDRFVSKITEEQKTLESKLLDVYDREFTRVVSDPLASIVKMLISAVERRIAEAKESRVKIQALIKEIDDVSPK